MGDLPERSAADREAARTERERRRAARTGRTPEARLDELPADHDDPTADHDDPTADTADHDDPSAGDDAVSVAGGDDVPGVRDGPADLPAAPAAPAAPGALPLAGAAEPEPEPAGISARPVRSFPSPPDPDFYEDPGGDREIASGTRRVSRVPGARRPARPPPRPRSGPARRARAPRRRSRGHSWLGRILSIVALFAAAAVVWLAIELFQPFGTSPHGRVTVAIPPRAGSERIGELLANAGVIGSKLFFELRATLAGDRGALRAGTYHLQQDMSYHDVLHRLTTPPKAAKTTQLTIAEGHNRQYVARLLARQRIRGNYVAMTRVSDLLDPRAYGAPRQLPDLEGFLFPDTFTLVEPVKMSTLIADQLTDFKRRFAGIDLREAERMHLSPYEVLTVASLIEGEASSRQARPIVASVIYNRLADHMMLGLDSTTRYATGNFTGPLTESQLHSRSPWNTRTHLGLPPTPIDSPSLSSIQAAAHPAHTTYKYFFSEHCNGEIVFANDYAQFLGQLARDQRTRCRR
ncbi:MAG: endolytic transglycosylase MltG [Solirubrobacterales bacterium]|nr:endolytic transglycosylase MltG [Solirubrobacterales bacterium]